LRFPGQYADPETGLHYNHQRYYDPATARYLSPDPLGLAPALNPHTYVRNPTTQTDPLGLMSPCTDDGSPEPLALPRGRAELRQQDLEHIVLRHWSTSDAAGAGKFDPGTTARNLRDMIQETVLEGTIRPNTLNRPGAIFENDLGVKIGTDIGDSDASWLRVVLNPDNTVRTAFPFNPSP
jgi:RHS repeat-associated protein